MSLYFVFKTFQPNTAPTNRFMAFVRGLSELGVQTTVCFFTSDGKGSKVKENYPNISFEYYWDKHSNSSCRKFWDLISVLKFICKLKRDDIVYIYGFPLLLLLMSRTRRCKCYYEIDECPDVYITKSSIFNMTPDKLLKCLIRISGLIVISRALKDYFIEKGIPYDKIHVVNMIVDSSRFVGLMKNTKEKYIAYCGTVSVYKDGVDKLLTAFSIMCKTINEYKLYVIGNIPSETDKQEINKIIVEKGLSNNVVLTGVVSYQEMPQLLKNADMLALARPDNIQAKYGFPTKLGEYLLAGNPVVVTKVGDIPLFLKDKQNALLVDVDRPDLFAEQMLWVATHPQEAKLIGNRGAAVAMTHFNYSIESNKLLEVLQQ